MNILLVGCNGKMGHAVAARAAQTPDLQIAAGIDCSEASLSFPVYTEFSQVKEAFDVIVDFSSPAVLSALLDYALAHKKPVVIATTGHSAEQIEAIRSAAKQIPVFFSATMSFGISLLAEIAATAAKTLGLDYDIEIIEKHHNQKVDAPSGTALLLADAVNAACNDEMEYVYERHSRRQKRDAREIGIHSIRGGSIVGEHEILFAGKDETLTLSHASASREVFAAGAVRAISYISCKEPGLYNMMGMVQELNAKG